MDLFLLRQILYNMSRRFIQALFINCILIGALYASNLNAQQIKSVKEVSIDLKINNLALVNVLKSIESRTGYEFSFKKEDIDPGIRISGNFTNSSVADVLMEISRQSDLKFKQINNNIHISKREVKSDLSESLEIVIQGITITGRVTSSEDNSGLPGVNVIVKGTTQGTVTDIEGNYVLEVPDQNSVVVFSSVGFLSEEVIPGSRTVIDLALTPDMTALEEIVVIGYGTAKKQDLTGSIATVNIENSKTLPNANAIQSFRNTVAGVVVTDNGRPGSDASIQIRGRNSISASNAPLIVLDGVIYTGGSLSDINPGDIESIHILKDASSTAIYGALAANGVIEVTTKKGTTQKPSISLNSFYGVSDFAFLPDRLDAEQYIAVRKDAEAADGGEIPFQPIELENMANGTSIDPWEEIRQSAPTYNGELSVSGKADRVNYYMSGNYITSKSPVAGDNFSRISGRLNLNAIITDWLNVGLNTGYTSKDYSGNRANLNDASFLSPWGSLYYDDGVPIRKPQNLGLVNNPLFNTIWNDRENISNTLFVNAYTGIELPIEGLNYKLNVGFTQRNDHTFIYNNSYDRDEFFNLGSGSKDYYQVQNLTLENIVKYSKVFNLDNEINATLLYGIYEFDDERSFLSSNNIWNDALGWNALEIGEGFNINTSARQTQQTSAMARIGYRYKGKYIVDASIRRDGYSAFGEGNKYGDFPSVGVSWVLSNENFISQNKLIDNLKVRLSWGKNGNRGVDPYSSLSNVAGTNYIFGDVGTPSVGQYITTMANPNLGWETTTSTNLGFDFGFFNNRINGSMDFYISQTSDLLLSQTIPNTNGFETFLRNIGETENKGFELSLNTVNVVAGDFTWGSNIAFTLNRNRIVKLTGRDIDNDGIEDDDIASRWFIGKPLGSNFDYVFDGIYQEGDDVSAIPGALPGHIRFKDIDGDGVITPDDRQWLHSNQPDYIMGFTNTFGYKGFSLLAVLAVRQGGYSSDPALNPGTNFYDQANILDLPYWTPENPLNDRPAINYKNPLGYGFYANRSFVRLQDVSLAYTFNSAILERLKMGHVQVYLSGKNLFTWTDWAGWDPEHGAGGVNPGNNGPLMKTYTIGLNIQF